MTTSSCWSAIVVWLCLLLSTPAGAVDLMMRADPLAAGIRAGPLASLLNHVVGAQLDVRSLLIARNGRIALEWHSALSSRDHNHHVFSVTKSVVSLLVGRALSQQSKFSVDSRVSDLFGVKIVDPRLAESSLEHLLMMRSGLPKTRAPSPAFARLHRAPDRVLHLLAQRSVYAANERFQYSNADSQLLAGAVEIISGKDLSGFAREVLFDPLQFRNQQWMYRDEQGLVAGGYGLRLRTIDMAKLGQLALQQGRWNDRQIVPAAYVQRAVSAGPDAFYGYQWWTNVAAGGHRSYAALGVRGQVIQVVPALKLVFVMTADLPKAKANSVRVDIIKRFVVPAADGAKDASNARAQLDRALGRAKGYRPASIRSGNRPRAGSADVDPPQR